MYRRSAPYFDEIYHFLDYSAAAQQVHGAIQRLDPPARTLLDVGCGTGRHLSLLREHYDVEGLELSDELLSAARRRCPDVRFHRGDMRDFDLGVQYDVVTCLFSAIAYTRSEEMLGAALENMARHLRPGGVMIVEPWYTPGQYEVGRLTTNVVDRPDLHIIWTYANAIEGRVAIQDIQFVIATPNGFEHFIERHELGLFEVEDYLRAFKRARVEASFVPAALFGGGMYAGRKDD